MDLRQIIQHRKEGIKNREIHRLTRIHRNTVNEYVQLLDQLHHNYDELLALDDAALYELLTQKTEKANTRYEQLAEQFEYFHKELKKPGATLQTLWEAYKARYPDGYQYTQFVYHYRQWEQSQQTDYKLTHRAGDKMFVDYTGKKLSLVDRKSGEIQEVDVFVAILPASQYIFVEPSFSQQREDFINSTRRALEFYGGSPKAIVPDNLKAAVDKTGKHQPQINKSFQDFGLHYGCTIHPARSYRPQDKALVENAVRLVYQHIFYPLSRQRFFSLAEISKAMRPLLLKLNQRMFSQVNYSRRELFLSTEQPYLQPLPASPYEIKHFKRAKVQKMGHVFLGRDKHYYSVPCRYIGKQVDIRYSRSTVEIYYNNHRLCTHKRDSTPGKYTTDKSHLSSAHRQYSEWSLDFFREKAAKIGPYTVEYVSKLILQYAYPEQGYKQAQGIVQLLREYDKSQIENACKRGLQVEHCSYRTIATILESGTEQLEMTFDDHLHIPSHDNIRGADNYQ